eukprot:m.230330 g.230330  ORF g.230330 m.230330 type:complete len:1313 (-) comp33578_c0_seq2:27-3965(-)
MLLCVCSWVVFLGTMATATPDLNVRFESSLHTTHTNRFSQSSRQSRADAASEDALEPAFFFGTENDIVQRNTWMTVQPSNQGPQPTAGAAMATWYNQPEQISSWGGSAFENTTSFKYGNFVLLMQGGMFLKTPKLNNTVNSTAPQQSSIKIGSEMFAMRELSGFWSERSFLPSNPGPRVYHTMNQCGDGRYVNGSQKLVLFGGIATLQGDLALSTYILDDDGLGIANSRWSVSPTATQPPLRYHHMTITLRPFARKVFLFGGTANAHIGNLFQSHADRWSHYSPVEQEEPDMSGMTIENSLFNDTWVYDAVDDEWSELDLPDPPSHCGFHARAAAGSSISGTTWFMIGGYNQNVYEDDYDLVLWFLELDGVDGVPSKGWNCQRYLQPYWPEYLGSYAHLPSASVVGGVLVNAAEIPVLVPPPDTPLGSSDNIVAPAPVGTWLGFCGGFYAHVGNLFTRVGCLILNVQCITNVTTECPSLQSQLADETIVGKIIVLPFAAKTMVQIGLNVANVVFGGTNGVLGFSDQMQIVTTQETPSSTAMFEVPRVSKPPQAPFAQAASMMVDENGHPNMFLVSNGRGGNQELIEPQLYILRSPRGTGQTSWTPIQNKKNNSIHPTMNEVVSSIEAVTSYNPSAIKLFVIVTNYAIYNVSIYPACQDWYVTECQPFYPGALWHLLRVIDVPPLEVFGIMYLYAQTDTVVVKINKTTTEVYSIIHPTRPAYHQIYRGAPFVWQGGAINKYVDNFLNELCVVAINGTTYYAGQLVGNGSFFWGEQTSNQSSAQQAAALPQSVVFMNSWYQFGGVKVQPNKLAASSSVGVHITDMFGSDVWGRDASAITNGFTVTRSFYNISTGQMSRTLIHVQVAGNTVGFSPESYGGATFASLAANTRDVILMQMGGFSKSGFQSSTLDSVPVIYLTCNAGQYSANFSILPCAYCPHGTYSNAVGAISCVDCGGGTSTPDVGSLNITSCNICEQNYCNGNGICAVETFGVARCTCYGGYTGVQCATESINLAIVVPIIVVGVAIAVVLGYLLYKRASRPIKTFHVFISYRVFSEASLARKIARKFREMELEENMKVECYLDQKNIESGTDWEKSFMEGLQRSCLFVPLISEQGTKPIESVGCFDEKADNLLMEYETALKMNKNDMIGIYPLLVGSIDDLGKYEKFGPHNFDVTRFSNGPSTTRSDAPVRQTMKELFKFQGDFISPSGLEDVQAEQMLSHLREKIWKSKDVDCMKLHRFWVVAQDLHTRADARFQRLATMVSPSSLSSSLSSSSKKATVTHKHRAPTWSKAPWESDLEASLLEQHTQHDDTTL